MYARRAGFGLAVMRLGIVYGPGPVGHDRPDSVTVVDKFRRLVARGRAADRSTTAAAATSAPSTSRTPRGSCSTPSRPRRSRPTTSRRDTLTRRRRRARWPRDAAGGRAACSFASPFPYEHRLADYLRDEVAGHRRDRLPGLAGGHAAGASAATTCVALARPAGVERAHAAGLRPCARPTPADPAARALLAGCDAVPALRRRARSRRRARETPRARCARTPAPR